MAQIQFGSDTVAVSDEQARDIMTSLVESARQGISMSIEILTDDEQFLFTTLFWSPGVPVVFRTDASIVNEPRLTGSVDVEIQQGT